MTDEYSSILADIEDPALRFEMIKVLKDQCDQRYAYTQTEEYEALPDIEQTAYALVTISLQEMTTNEADAMLKDITPDDPLGEKLAIVIDLFDSGRHRSRRGPHRS